MEERKKIPLMGEVMKKLEEEFKDADDDKFPTFMGAVTGEMSNRIDALLMSTEHQHEALQKLCVAFDRMCDLMILVEKDKIDSKKISDLKQGDMSMKGEDELF